MDKMLATSIVSRCFKKPTVSNGFNTEWTFQWKTAFYTGVRPPSKDEEEIDSITMVRRTYPHW